MRLRFTLDSGLAFHYEPKMHAAVTIAAVAEDIAAMAPYTRRGRPGWNPPMTLADIAHRRGVTVRTVCRVRKRMLAQGAIEA